MAIARSDEGTPVSERPSMDMDTGRMSGRTQVDGLHGAGKAGRELIRYGVEGRWIGAGLPMH